MSLEEVERLLQQPTIRPPIKPENIRDQAMLSVFESRFGVQVTTCTTDDILAKKLGA